jgi:hypothetical protein
LEKAKFEKTKHKNSDPDSNNSSKLENETEKDNSFYEVTQDFVDLKSTGKEIFENENSKINDNLTSHSRLFVPEHLNKIYMASKEISTNACSSDNIKFQNKRVSFNSNFIEVIQIESYKKHDFTEKKLDSILDDDMVCRIY